ncbi:MAG: glycosyl hydrolase family 28-related protein [bacterium]|nr:glycosyl hydrolase family 28-related protein [bacterium]
MRISLLERSLFALLSAALLGITFQCTHLSGTARAETADTITAQDIGRKSWDETVDNVRKYADFAAAISGIGSNVRTLLIPVSTIISSNVTVPANVTLLFWGEGRLNITTGTVTINGPVQAPTKQIFNCTAPGKVSFSGNKGKLERVYPQWWGARGDGSTDDTAAIQDAVNAAATMNGNNGGLVFFLTGRYKTSKPIVLPRTGADGSGRTVRLQGSGMRGGTTIGSSKATDFPRNRALIEWEARTACVLNQSIRDMAFSLPDVKGVSAIHYKLNGKVVLSQTFQADLENLLILGDNSYHQRLIRLEGSVKESSIDSIYGDCVPGTSANSTIVLEVDSTPVDGEAGGLNCSTIRAVQGGLTRGGRHQVFKGRISGSSFTSCYNSYGSGKAPAYEFINSRASTITNIGNSGGGTPQLRLTGCRSLTINGVSLGTSGGNGIEFINTDDCSWTGHYRSKSDIAFSSIGRKNLVLDAGSRHNRFYNFHINGLAAKEIQDSGIDNYCECYDVGSAKGWQFVGKLHQGSTDAKSVSGISGVSAGSIAARNLRGSVTISGTAVSAPVTFAVSEQDTSYYLTLTPVGGKGIPVADSRVVKSITKKITGFTVNLAAAPGAGNSVTYDWQLFR